MNQQTQQGYRLTTEAEWEYAGCRSGSTNQTYHGRKSQNAGHKPGSANTLTAMKEQVEEVGGEIRGLKFVL